MLTPEQFFRRLAASIPRLEREITNKIIAVEAERFVAENFEKEGYTDTSFKPWQPRKQPDKQPQRRALLVKTSALKGHALKGRVKDTIVQFVLPLPYAKVHNKGGRAGRGAGFTMPQRQYIGKSSLLNRRVKKKTTDYLTIFLTKL